MLWIQNIYSLEESSYYIEQKPFHVNTIKEYISSAGVYKIPCSCRKIYIGETGRTVNIRMKEHQRNVGLKHITQSALYRT